MIIYPFDDLIVSWKDYFEISTSSMDLKPGWTDIEDGIPGVWLTPHVAQMRFTLGSKFRKYCERRSGLESGIQPRGILLLKRITFTLVILHP